MLPVRSTLITMQYMLNKVLYTSQVAQWERICLPLQETMGSVSWIEKIPCRRKWQHTPVFLPGKSCGQRGLVGYSPWGLKSVRHELATNQQQQQGFIQKHTQNKDIYWMIEENVTRGSQEPDPVFPVRAAIQYLLIHSCLEYWKSIVFYIWVT